MPDESIPPTGSLTEFDPTANIVVRLLGRVQVRTADGWISAGSPKQAAVLAALVLAAGDVVPIEVLSGQIWDGNPPASARGVIHSHVARLRRLLEHYDDVSLGRASSGGYELRVPGHRVDLFAARNLARRARAATESGDDVAASRWWRDCLGLWRAPVLSGVDSAWVDRVRRRLDREYRDLAIDRMTTELRLGVSDEVIAELEDLSTRFSNSEAIAELTMRGLYRADRREEALRHYERVRSVLNEDLGTDPGASLQRLQQEILGRQSESGPARESGTRLSGTNSPDHAVTASAPDPIRPRQLPAAVSDFTGRVDQLASLTRRLRETGSGSGPASSAGAAPTIVAIDGMPGVGKTALAVRVAHDLAAEFPDGQVFIDLHGFSGDVPAVTPADALARMLRALGIATRQLPDDVADRAAMFRSAVANRRILFVLDNAASEDQVIPLLPGSSNCAVLITSRRKLAGLDDVGLESLDVLSPVEAVALFASVHRHPTAASMTSTSQIVELCGQLPLAIRLAAARLRSRPSWTLDQLRDRLIDHGSRLAELRAGQRSVAVAFELSFGELDADTRRAFALLGTTALVEYSVDSVAALLGSSRRAAESIMEELVDRNLVQLSEPDRYLLHDLMRLFAHGRATGELTDEETRDALVRLRNWWSHSIRSAMTAARLPRNDWLPLPPVADRVTPMSFTGIEPALGWLDGERVNLMAVIGVEAPGDGERTWELVDIAFDYLSTYLDPASLTALTDRGLTAAIAAGDRRAQALMHLRISSVRHMIGDPLGDDEHARLAEELQGDETALRRRALMRRAVANATLGRFATARDHITAALESAEGHPTGQLAVILNIAGAIASQTGEFVESREHLNRALEVLRAIGSPRIYVVMGNLGLTDLRLGDFDIARKHLDQALASARQMRTPRDEPAVLDNLAQWHLLRGDLASARRSARSAIEIATEARLDSSAPSLLVTLSATYCDQPIEAERLARKALASLGDGDRSYTGIRARITLADALSNPLAGRESLPEAIEHTMSAIELGTRAGCRHLVADASTLRARIALATGEIGRAVELAEAALTRHTRTGHRPGMAVTRLLLAEAHQAAGDHAAARRQQDEATALRVSMNLGPASEDVSRPAG